MSAPNPTRNMVVARLGTPDRTEGSLNDPREHEENGFRFNEKWIYAHLSDDPARVPMRTIYWMRYDFLGTVVRASESEPWRVDTKLAEALAVEEPSRLPPLDPSHNRPIAPTAEYHPVSEFKGPPDLGGHIQ